MRERRREREREKERKKEREKPHTHTGTHAKSQVQYAERETKVNMKVTNEKEFRRTETTKTLPKILSDYFLLFAGGTPCVCYLLKISQEAGGEFVKELGVPGLGSIIIKCGFIPLHL